MSWYFHVLGKYAVFAGRARRKEYWMFLLFNMIFSVVAIVADNLFGSTFIFGDGYYKTSTIYGWIYLIYILATFLPGISVFVRRMHDIGKSGWWFFIFFIPIIGWIWGMVLLCKDSNFGDNKYGSSPKGSNSTMVPKEIVNDMDYDLNKPIINFSPEKTTIKKIPLQSKNEVPKMNEKTDITLNENELYEQVWREIEKNKTDVGLWAKCFSNCEGDENKTKALYVNKRVLVLKENLQKQLIEQERKAKEEAKKEIEKDLASQKLAKKFLAFEGRTDDIFIFKKTIETMPTFFPKILDKFGYKLVQNKDKQEMWSIHLPNESGTKMVYDLFDLRKEIRKIVEKEYKKTWKCDCGAETEEPLSNCSKCQKFRPLKSRLRVVQHHWSDDNRTHKKTVICSVCGDIHHGEGFSECENCGKILAGNDSGGVDNSSKTKMCPSCNLVNSATATQCDCGKQFT